MNELNTIFESSDESNNILSYILDSDFNDLDKPSILKVKLFETPLGPMIAIGDEKFLYLLEFMEKRALQREVERLKKKTSSTIILGETTATHSIKEELKLYFAGKLKKFNTPICLLGSPFQKQVWDELQKIPYGETRSYLDVAKSIGNPLACRAVANANGTNQISIVVPCHRVINENGNLGGYGGGIHRKQGLLDLEKS